MSTVISTKVFNLKADEYIGSKFTSNDVLNLFNEDVDVIVINASTGSGKTTFAVNLINYILKIEPNAKILLDTSRTTLIVDFENSLKTFPNNVSINHYNKSNAHSEFDFVIIDEIHNISEATYVANVSSIFEEILFSNVPTILMSATLSNTADLIHESKKEKVAMTTFFKQSNSVCKFLPINLKGKSLSLNDKEIIAATIINHFRKTRMTTSLNESDIPNDTVLILYDNINDHNDLTNVIKSAIRHYTLNEIGSVDNIMETEDSKFWQDYSIDDIEGVKSMDKATLEELKFEIAYRNKYHLEFENEKEFKRGMLLDFETSLNTNSSEVDSNLEVMYSIKSANSTTNDLNETIRLNNVNPVKVLVTTSVNVEGVNINNVSLMIALTDDLTKIIQLAGRNRSKETFDLYFPPYSLKYYIKNLSYLLMSEIIPLSIFANNQIYKDILDDIEAQETSFKVDSIEKKLILNLFRFYLLSKRYDSSFTFNLSEEDLKYCYSSDEYSANKDWIDENVKTLDELETEEDLLSIVYKWFPQLKDISFEDDHFTQDMLIEFCTNHISGFFMYIFPKSIFDSSFIISQSFSNDVTRINLVLKHASFHLGDNYYNGVDALKAYLTTKIFERKSPQRKSLPTFNPETFKRISHFVRDILASDYYSNKIVDDRSSRVIINTSINKSIDKFLATNYFHHKISSTFKMLKFNYDNFHADCLLEGDIDICINSEEVKQRSLDYYKMLAIHKCVTKRFKNYFLNNETLHHRRVVNYLFNGKFYSHYQLEKGYHHTKTSFHDITYDETSNFISNQVVSDRNNGWDLTEFEPFFYKCEAFLAYYKSKQYNLDGTAMGKLKGKAVGKLKGKLKGKAVGKAIQPKTIEKRESFTSFIDSSIKPKFYSKYIQYCKDESFNNVFSENAFLKAKRAYDLKSKRK